MFSCQRCLLCLLLLFGGSLQDSENNTACSKQSVLLHNIKPNYNMDMREVLQVWVKTVQDPWQDNRLIAGVSDPAVLSFNLTSSHHTTEFQGVITRNLTATIFQHPAHVYKLLTNRSNFSGEFEFHIKTFSENEECKTKVSTNIALGCPVNRQLKVHGQKFKECEEFKNFNYTISSDQLLTGETAKLVNYASKTLGCPIHSDPRSMFKPTVSLYDGDQKVKEVTSNFIMWEKNGRNSYHYSHTMEEVGCLKASQSWSEMFDDTSEVDIDQAWTQKNFQSCFEKDESTTEETNLKKPYEIMNSTGGSALMWDDGGIYIFKLRVIDPHSSFCDLTAEFAVTVPDMKTSDKELPTFVVLGASSFGIILGCIVAFYIDAYCF